ARREGHRSWVDLDLVVDRGDGGPVNPDTLSSGWYRIRRAAGVPGIRFHDLRHAHATLMLVKGIHPKVVSERLGHATVGITLDLYSHVLPSMQLEAAQAFDDLFPSSGDVTEGRRLSNAAGVARRARDPARTQDLPRHAMDADAHANMTVADPFRTSFARA